MSHRPGDLPGDISNLIDLLRWRAARQPDRTAFTFLVDGEHETLELTYGELDRRARAIAARLQQEGAAAERAILLYPPGLEYIAAFFGCLYAGTIAVPAYPPRFNRNATRLQAIVADAQATIALTTTKTFTSAQQQFEKLPDLAALRWHSIDAEVSGEDAWREPTRSGETLAFLQYTSGSTGTPKGVMLSHGNLLYNLSLIYESFEINGESVAVSWLPPYHDMGLIAGIMLPIYAGMPTTLMSPAAFLQRPLRWLEAISRVRATHSGGPNFAYELCVERSTAQQRANLDLSSWTLGLNGAEPIRRETLDRFTAAFARIGFRREVFYPAYGLAEASLIVAGGARSAPPIVSTFNSQALENNRVVADTDDETARTLVGCGTQLRGQEFRIVDPETCRECQADQIGEIWVRGPSVAQGYWNQPETTEQTFRAQVADSDDGPFLRTGDLGFLNNGELFVTGRLKDLIIIRGRNHYPQDIEQTVARSHPALRLDYGAAFAVEVAGVEQLVVVQEVDRQQRHADLDAVISAIRRAVAEQHDLQIYSIALLKHGSIPKTSSGKIQRHACRNGLRDGTLDVIKLWTFGDGSAPPAVEPSVDRSTPTAAHKTGAEIQTWLIAQLAERLKIAAQSIDVREPFASYGLDSVAAIGIAGALEESLDRSLPPTLVYDYPNIAALASYLADEPAADDESLPSVTSGDEHEPIAIIGLGCRMPGAADPDAFWQLLREGVDAIGEVPAERWDADALYDARAATAGKMNTRWGGFLEQVDRFDAQFFGVAPREAVQMDPQQRLLLEVAWEALENAGQIPEQLAGDPVGVFVGISASDYSRLHQRHASELDAYIGVGNALSIAANRLSYLLDFHGPSIAVDTACSSSLVALHLACQSLRRGESSMALAGGVNLILTPDLTIAFSQARMMSASGRCKTFDADADGYVRGEGCGVIVLKRLSDALRDNDPIMAVVRGSAVNQDGRSNGLTAPNAHAQQAVIRQALADAQLAPNQIGYVEAHGTGTPLGDPIEFQALSNVLHEDRAANLPCFVGSVKTNIGHLEAAAGIAGVIKVVLALKHQEIAPHLHLTQLNPYIQTEGTPLLIATQRRPWTRGDTPRIAGVSSFGFGGTNAHVILAEAPVIAPAHVNAQPHDERPLHVLTLSAKSERSLRELARRYNAFLSGTSESLADICYSANTTRSHFAQRLAVTGDTTEELRSALASFAAGQESVSLVQGTRSGSDRPKIAFLFTGQGSHYAGMARQLYTTQATFRQAIDRCAAILDKLLDRPLPALLQDEDAALLDRTDYAQPVLFALEYALAELWQSWGVRPDLVLGHSVGEYVAACVAGACSLEDGLALMVERGRLMSQTQPGAMAAIFAAPDRVRPLLELDGEQVAIAALNGPENTVISGEPAAVQAILDTLPAAGISFRVLPVTQAFHSSLLDPMLDAFEQAASRLSLRAPQIPLVSNLTGRILEAGTVQDARYWRRHAREVVDFGAGLQTLADQGCTLFVEIGPGSALLSQGRRALSELEAAWLPSLKQGADDWSILLHSLSVLYVQGVAVDWAAFDRGYERRRVDLPTYQFDRERYWLDTSATHSTAGALANSARAALHPLLGYRLRSALPAIQFESQLSVGAPAFLDDHRVQGVTVLPATAYLMMALAAAESAFGAGAYELTDVTFHEALFLPDAGSRTTQIVLTRQTGDATRFEILSLPAESAQRATWTQHVTGTIRHDTDPAAPTIATFDLHEIRARCQESIAGAAHYGQLHDRGLHYGPSFQGVVEIMRRDGEALGRMQLPESLQPEADAYPVHPALLDACLQVLADTPTQDVRGAGQDTYLPIGLQALRIYRRPETRLWSYAVLRSDTNADADSFSGDVLLLDESGAVVVEAQGLRLQSLSRATRRSTDQLSDWLYELTWQPQTIEPPTNPAQIERERWLILADRRGVGQQLQALLVERGVDCVTVSADQIDAANPVAFGQLLAEHSCRRIVHLWSLDAPPLATLTEAELAQAQILGSGSVIAMMQALATTNWNEPPQLWVVTEGAQSVVGDAVAVAQAPVWGLGRSIALEQPEHWGGLIDIEAGVAPDLAALIEQIANTTDENQIAWRGGQRYVARLSRVEDVPIQPQPILLHAAGTYLITGGLGSLGLQVARWMVEQGARRLVLLGRSALPDRASWENLPEQHPASDQIAALIELERLGATVVVAQADVADQSQMQALFTELRRTLPAIRGIVHAAGVAQPTPLAALDPATLTAVLRPKVEGAWVLHQLSRQLPLDFFVCFSSIAAVWGSRELAHYAAANHFLDALAHLRRSQGLPALSINWGPWAERGMAATAERNRALKLTGLNPLPAQQALTALSYAMQSAAAQQIVVDAEWATFTALYGVKSSARLFEQIADRAPAQIPHSTASSDQRDQLLSLSSAERRAQLLDDLRRQVAGVLRLEPARLDVEQPLNTLGLDSLMAVELKNGIEASLRVSLPIVTFLQGPSIAQLTDETLARMGDAAPVAASAPPKLVAAHDTSPEQPLSLGQRALWFLHQLAPDSTAYNIVGASKIRSVVDLEAMQRVFQRLVDRHPSLRTTFTAPSGTPVQVIHQQMEVFFQTEDASAWSEAELNARLVAEAHRPFDLEVGPLFRAYLFTRAPEEHVLLLAVHHTIADFWSLVVLINEVGVLYPAEITGTSAALAPLDVTYADYARWQAEMLRGAEGARLWSYWSQQLASDLPFLNLPTDKPRPAVQTYRGASQTLTIDAALTQQLKALCEDHRTTLYTALMAAWHALLHRYTSQDDILVGSPIAGRNWAEVAGLVGYFVSPVVIRGNFADQPSFGALLDQMRQTVLDALEHHQYPLALLAERLKPVRDPSRSPLFQAMFILQKAQLLNDQGLTPFVLRETGAQMGLGGLTLESLALEQRVAQFDLTLVMVEANGGLVASLEYNTDLFEAATIERMLGHFKTLLAAMVAQPSQPIVTLPLLTESERRYLLADLNATALSYPRTQRLHELFEAQAARTPDAIAVVFGNQQLTYAELDRRANQLAHRLQSRSVGPDRLVGVCLHRSPEMVIALLAVLKAGGAYVPLDPNYPSERIRYVLEDSRAALLLTQESSIAGLRIEDYRHEVQVLCLDRDWPTIAQASEQPPVCAADTEDLAYVIYTSGSLGRPKGVQIPHRAVVNFLSSMQREPGLAAHDTLLSVTTLSFDIAGLEIFLPLSVGARLIVASREVAADGQRLIRLLDETATTVMQATPATWRLLIESGWQGSPNLRVLCGGEALPQDLAEALIARSVALWNLYGPTETTIWSLAQQIDAEQPRVTIGRPIANTQIYLLDAMLQPVPIGVPGQISIGGDGLARGYLNRPELTAEKFIPDPFNEKPGSRLYQTGDLARYLPDGTLEFLGRIDHQVKVRGYRIELGEIEAVLRQQPAVRDAVVVAREVAGDTRLVAYVVGENLEPRTKNLGVEEQKNKETKEQANKEQRSTTDAPSPVATEAEARQGSGKGESGCPLGRAGGEGLSSSSLRAFLRSSLPEYMIPSAIMVLDALPQTPNGKIDRKALPSPEGLRSELEAYVAPQTELETMIATIWQELLGLERVGVHDNFFDLGGHSLLTAQVHSRLRSTLGREISIVDLFKYPTIAALAQYLGQDQPAQPRFEQTFERVAAYRNAVRNEHATSDIAIVGMAGRFPGAANVEEFWRNISAGVESLKHFTDEELLAAGVNPALLDHPQYVKIGPALDGIELFDASFFGYNPREAALLDPQQRLFLTSAYEALEHAGYDSQQYSGAIGVYAGAGMNTYLINNLLTNRQLAESVSDFQTMISNDKDFLTTRVSYLLNLRGPSVNVQSACSTSLVAVTLACQSLLNHQCDLALAGGVSLRVPQTGYLYQEEGIRSPDGHCRAFDASAQGTIFGSGVGVVVLKRLTDALNDGDTIHAVIRGAAINNDGSGKIGYTAPSVDGQAQVIAEALAVAGVDPATIDYVEAHGTGTALGDPIEIAALTEAFRATTDARGYCAIGSVKTNVGHLDTAAGVAGLIKTVQALKHRQLPPSLHFEQPNPQIDFASSPFYVNNQLSEWPERERPRRAGVSALGIGGTNAHVIVEESPVSAESDPGRPWQILLLSAKTATALETATTKLAEHLRQHPEQSLADVAYTLQVGRRSFNHRRVLVCRDHDDTILALESRDPQRVVTHMQEPGARNIAFMFPGGGAQYVNMASELYAHEPAFKETIDRCAELLGPQLRRVPCPEGTRHGTRDLREFLYPANASPADARRLEQPSLALPALFATEYALAQLWISWGVKPTAMIGHSLGEYVAACLAGVISLADALALVTLRGQLFEQLPPGAMLSVPLPEADLLPLLGADLSLAAVNGPTLSVVAGPIAAIEALAQTLAVRGIETNRLHIDVAAHSAMLEPILEPFGAFVRTITLSPPQTRFISNVTGTWITDAQATDPEYWVTHLRQTVYFGAGVGELLNRQNPHSSEILLEVGPGHTLSALVRQAGHDLMSRVIVSSLRRPTEQQPDLAFLLNTLGQLILAGVPIDWSAFYRGQRRQRLPLPTYPFEPQRYWIDPQPLTTERAQPSLDKKPNLADWGYLPIWKQAPLPPRTTDAEPTTVLFFAHISELSACLIERLEQAGHRVVKVRTGNFFRQHNDRSYMLNPREPAEYEALLQALGDQPITRIVHAWSVMPDDVENLDRPALGFYSLLFLAQALGKHAQSTPIEISVLTNSAHEIIGGDGQQPEQATVLGAVRVIPQEYSQISCRSVDLVLPTGERYKRQLFDQLVAELLAPPADTLVAYRGNQRWTQDFAPQPIAPSSTAPTRLRKNGVYLITGGLGAIGLVLAEYLARTVQAKLVLVNRSEFPVRADWPKLIATADEHDATRRRIEQVQALEALGTEVLILSADVADLRQMQPVLDQTIERFGTLHGVIHAAGVPAGGMIQTKTAESAASVLAPKVQGTQVLAELLRDQQLDFMVLCSSISAVVGSFGQIDHCAANAFLDAWARHAAAHSNTPIIAINWPAWQDIGQAANAAIPAELLAWRTEQLKQGIVAAEGAELFGRILALDTPQVIVSPQDLTAVIEHNRSLNAATYLSALEAGQIAAPSHPRPLLRTAYVAPRNEIEQTVAEIWQQLLGIEQIGIHDNFFDLGGHSLLATQIVSRLRERFQVELSLRQLLETPTIGDVALAIVQQQGAQASDDLLAQMLMELEELSDDDARDLLDFETPVAE